MESVLSLNGEGNGFPFGNDDDDDNKNSFPRYESRLLEWHNQRKIKSFCCCHNFFFEKSSFKKVSLKCEHSLEREHCAQHIATATTTEPARLQNRGLISHTKINYFPEVWRMNEWTMEGSELTFAIVGIVSWWLKNPIIPACDGGD